MPSSTVSEDDDAPPGPPPREEDEEAEGPEESKEVARSMVGRWGGWKDIAAAIFAFTEAYWRLLSNQRTLITLLSLPLQ